MSRGGGGGGRRINDHFHCSRCLRGIGHSHTLPHTTFCTILSSVCPKLPAVLFEMTRRITARNCNYFIKSCRIIDLSNFINIYGKKEKVSELKNQQKKTFI